MSWPGANVTGTGVLHAVRLRRPSRLALLVGAILFEAIVAAACVRKPKDVIAACLGAAGLALAATRPRAIAVLALLFIALVPVYAAPKVGALELQPAVCALWLCALGSAVRIIGRNERLTFTVIDAAVALYAIATVMSVLAGARLRTELIQNTFYWLGPYLGLRLLLSRSTDDRWLPRAFLFTAVTVMPFAAYEFVSGQNLFLHLAFNKMESAIWATSQARLGAERVDASFGQSIAFGMFMATALLFAIALAAAAERRKDRLRWLALGALFLGGIAASISRTGWVVAVAGLALVTIGSTGRARRVLVSVVVALACVLLIVAVAAPHSPISPLHVFAQQSSNSELEGSDSYRVSLLANALGGGRLGLFGTTTGALTLGIIPGYSSIDDAYLAVGNDWGIVSMLALVGVALAVAGSMWRLRRHSLQSAIIAITLANFVGLLFVALITQQAYYIWALVGACAALASNESAARRMRAAVPSSSLRLRSAQRTQPALESLGAGQRRGARR